MSEAERRLTESVPSTVYTRDYYTSCCHGYEEFAESYGGHLPLRLSVPFELGRIQPADRVLDVGCGRGELLIHCARRGAIAWGLDYAKEALHLAVEMLDRPEYSALRQKVRLLRGSVLDLPFGDAEIDVVFMLDVVEHLYPEELAKSFGEIHRVLKPGGRLIVHTMPNLWYYRWGYPLFRSLQRLRGHRLPADPRDRWAYSDVHVNEQTPSRLRGSLKERGFHTKVWLKTAQSYEHEENSVVRTGMHLLSSLYPFRLIFCNDIFAIGTKK